MASTKPKTLSDFKSAHDRNTVIPAKINKTLIGMLKEHAESWEYEQDFMKRANISPTDMGQFRGQFEQHIVVASGKNPKRVWFADPKVAKKARGE